jgi:hypothetical protein
MRKFAALCAAALMTFSMANVNASDIKSGLQVDEHPPAFHVVDITGPAAGEELCYRCKFGARPVVSLFVRKMDENTVKLIKELDAVVAKNADDKKMAAFVTLLTEDPDSQEAELKKIAEEQKLEHTPLTVFANNVGPTNYKIDEKADVTVMMWVNSSVKVNHAFARDELTSEAIEKVVGDTGKILQE